MNHPSSLIALTSLLLLAPGCMIDWDDWGDYDYMAESTERFTISAADVDSVAVSTHNGTVRLNGEPGTQEVRVSVRKQARGSSQENADHNLRTMEVTDVVRNGRLELGWDWSEGRSGSRSGSVTFSIEAPPELNVSVDTHNGQVHVRGWTGNLAAETHNGGMDIDGAFGEVELITHNGDIIARLQGSGAVNGRIETHNGAVEVRVGEGLSAMIVASTDNGRVEVVLGGDYGSAIPMVFADSVRRRVEFQPVFYAPANGAPYFSSVPVTSVVIDGTYRYVARAGDPNGHPVSLE